MGLAICLLGSLKIKVNWLFQYKKNINRTLAICYTENEVEIKVKGNLVNVGDNEIELKYSDKSIIIYYEQIIDAKVLVSFK